MEKLPQELINRIVWFAERYPGAEQWYPAPGQYSGITEFPSQFPRLAVLNRLWKEAIEAVTFHEIGLKSDEFASLQLMVTGRRRNHLAKLSFAALLPEYSDEDCGRPETWIEQRANNQAFTKGISDLFTLLKSWEDDGVQNALQLFIRSPASPTDSRMRGPGSDELRYAIATRERIDIFWRRWQTSCLHLLDPTSLPILSNVTHINVRGNDTRALDACTAPDLALRLPNLKIFKCEFSDCIIEPNDDARSSDDASLMFYSNSDSDLEQEPLCTIPNTYQERSANRLAFATKLQGFTCASTGSADITFYHEFPEDQTLTASSLLPPGHLYDPFSSALRTFSQNLSSLTISAHIDATLFWPHPSDPNSTIPHWPNLKHLHVAFNMVAPDGSWYFTGPIPQASPADDSDSDSDASAFYRSRFRIHPNRQTFDPFLASFANAVCNMPVLEYFELECELMGDTGRLHIMYNAPNKKAEWGDIDVEDEGKRRVYYACEIGDLWVPEEDTAQKLRSAGEARFAGEVVERWVGSLYV